MSKMPDLATDLPELESIYAGTIYVDAAQDLVFALKTLLSVQDTKEHDHPGSQGHDIETCALCIARETVEKFGG